MNLDELIEKVPKEWHPVVREFGPVLLQMTVDEIWAWIQLLAAGKNAEAYRVLLAKLDDPGLLAEWTTLEADWAKANEANKARMALQRQAAEAILRVLLGVALALVGL